MLAVDERTDHPRSAKHRAVRSQQKLALYRTSLLMNLEYACPACGFLVFNEPPGSYDICPLCNWEDDLVQLRSPGYAGGANSESLCEYQARIALVKSPPVIQVYQGFRRDPAWRPLRSSECFTEVPSGSIELPYYWKDPGPVADGFHRARIAWSSTQLALGLPGLRSTIDPSWLDGAVPTVDDGWSLVCEFDRPPSVQGNPTAGRIMFAVAEAPHAELKAGARLKLFERATGKYAIVEVLE